jgi:ribA/ribD-fused uncharacterized protein
MNKIDRFVDEYRFLSNFFPSTIDYNGKRWKTVEHAYQAAKTLDESEKKAIHAAPTPGQAKKLGRIVKIREDWEQIKFSIMQELVEEKFKNPILRQLLLDTQDAELIEGNNWNDVTWGVYKGIGQNWLGKILMSIRAKIKNEQNVT